MANPTLETLRSAILDSVKGRKLGLSPTGYLQGQLSVKEPQTGLAASTTLISTATAALPAYGVSIIGSTITSGATSYTLADPVPGVRKVLFNGTTGTATVTLLSTTAGQGIVSTGSAASTYSVIQFVGKGAMAELVGLSTLHYAMLTPLAITTVTTGNLVQIS